MTTSLLDDDFAHHIWATERSIDDPFPGQMIRSMFPPRTSWQARRCASWSLTDQP